MLMVNALQLSTIPIDNANLRWRVDTADACHSILTVSPHRIAPEINTLIQRGSALSPCNSVVVTGKEVARLSVWHVGRVYWCPASRRFTFEWPP